MARLTRRQLVCLAQLGVCGTIWIDYYHTDRDQYARLERLGLARRFVPGERGEYPHERVYYRITPAGRAHVRRACEVGE